MEFSTEHDANLRLGQLEYQLQRMHLQSRPRFLGLVLSNKCNIGCIHCYQAKNGDSLLEPAEIGAALRREFSQFYPYLSTLRVQGGEVFVIPGFRELVDDVTATVDRPILSISTNGTLIDDEWAEKIVRTPFGTVTVSIDGGTAATYAKLRKGAQLETVLEGLKRLAHWKKKLGSPRPFVDSFFVVMRSNFREIPQYLEMMRAHGIGDVSFQTIEINDKNTSRVLRLADDEEISSRSETLELHRILTDALARERDHFRQIRVSGLTTLFEQHGLDGRFLREESAGLYPDSDSLGETFELCPNPWTTLFVAENGDVHLCFLSEPVGNLYQMPLAAIWNSPRAIAKRAEMIAGRYVESGCSPRYCGWRQGKPIAPPAGVKHLIAEMGELARLRQRRDPVEETPAIAAVRRVAIARERQVAEMTVLFEELWSKNQRTHEEGQRYIDELEAELARLRGQLDKPLVRIARKVGAAFG